MPLRYIDVPSLGRRLSCLMAAPASGAPSTHTAGLDAFRAIGGDCYHLHGEGGETHSRAKTGAWLRRNGVLESSFLCTQICHDDWDPAAERPVDRFTPEAVHADVAADLALLGADYADYVDMAYLDDRPSMDFEGVLQALGAEIAAGRMRASGTGRRIA